MSERSLAQQEREIQEAIRRAKATPDKSSSLRKDVLTRLINLTKSPHTSLKILSATHIPAFFNSFPDAEEDAINAIYDLCEDQSSEVRLRGYNAIADISKSQPKWIKRNADVLIQLLQSDDPHEVSVVRSSLNKHIDMDPKITLGVLCDQFVPSDEPMDEDEKALRDRLRDLVISFLSSEVKRIARHATPMSPSEEVLMTRILPNIPRINKQHVEFIIKSILFSLPSFKSPSAQGNEVMQILMSAAKAELRPDFQSVSNVQFYLGLAAEVSLKHHAASSFEFLRLYHSSLLGKITLHKVQKEMQATLICGAAEYFSEYEKTKPPSHELQSLRKQVTECCPVLLQVLATLELDQRVQNACFIFLQTCQQRKVEDGWVIPAHFSNTLASLQACKASGEHWAQVQALITSLQPPPPPPVVPKPVPAAQISPTTSFNHVQPSPKLSQPMTEASLLRNPLPQRPSSAAAVTFSGSSSFNKLTDRPASAAGSNISKRGQVNEEPSTRPMKKTRNDSNSNGGPSLLDRITTGSRLSSDSAPTSRQARSPQSRHHEQQKSGRHDSTAADAAITAESKPTVGFSIKGAAKAAALGQNISVDSTSIQRPSLLQRLDSKDQQIGGVPSNDNVRRKRKER